MKSGKTISLNINLAGSGLHMGGTHMPLPDDGCGESQIGSAEEYGSGSVPAVHKCSGRRSSHVSTRRLLASARSDLVICASIIEIVRAALARRVLGPYAKGSVKDMERQESGLHGTPAPELSAPKSDDHDIARAIHFQDYQAQPTQAHCNREKMRNILTLQGLRPGPLRKALQRKEL